MRTGVKDVMTTEVVSVEEQTSFKDIVRVMHANHVSAVPVLDSTGQVRGVVSESDLLLKQADPDAVEESHLSPARRRAQRKATGAVAEELMTSPAITLPESATIEDAAARMRRYKINQLPVIDALTGRLVGIVGRRDVLAVYGRSDADIHRDVARTVIAEEFGLDPGRFVVTVTDGRVTVEGSVERRSQIPTLLHAIRHVEGVVSATSRLDYQIDDAYTPFTPYF